MCRLVKGRNGKSIVCEASELSTDLTTDPEEKYRRYGSFFGKKYFLDLGSVFGPWTRVKSRRTVDRQIDQLVDLAVVNERLAGRPAWEVRSRLEHLKKDRKNWEQIFEYVTKQEAVATLAVIEEANRKVGDSDIVAKHECSF